MMSFSEERIYYLLQVYTNHTATAIEEEELYQWASLASDGTMIKEHIAHLIEAHPDERFPGVDWEGVYQAVLQRTRSASSATSRKRMHWHYAAAAILMLVVAGSSIYLFSPRKNLSRESSIQGKAQEDNRIHPGGPKAILQAGNTQVILNKKDTTFSLAGNAVRVNGGNLQITDAKPVQYTLFTPRGGEYRLVLTDGTIVWLNAGSRLRYPSTFTGNMREVALEGEAYFQIHADGDHPFIVHTHEQDIRVLGTEFNVHAYPDETDMVTTLVKGKLQVNSSGKTLVLQPGQQAQSNKGDRLILKTDADIEQAIAWKNGYFRFNKVSIVTIMQQLSRWYDVNVQYEKGIKTHYFGAIISRDNDITQILQMLEATGAVHFKIEGKSIMVMP